MNVCIIGGGAAGMMAAITAADCGHRVTLLERQARVGRKLMATGNGRCYQSFFLVHSTYIAACFETGLLLIRQCCLGNISAIALQQQGSALGQIAVRNAVALHMGQDLINAADIGRDHIGGRRCAGTVYHIVDLGIAGGVSDLTGCPINVLPTGLKISPGLLVGFGGGTAAC